jgi:sugar lactone lactonase YvrE
MKYSNYILAGLSFSLIFTACKKTSLTPIEFSGPSVSTIGGNGNQGFLDGVDSNAEFYALSGLTIDKQDNIFVADGNRIRKISPQGDVHTLAGTGIPGFVDGGTNAEFNYAVDVALDPDGNVYVTDWWNNRIRKITTTGLVSTFAGNGHWGFADGTTNAEFFNPAGITSDASGNLFVADLNNNRIRKISTSGMVSTMAGSGNPGYLNGNGITAQFNQPNAVAVDLDGNLYVADLMNNCIRKISLGGIVSTLAGSGIQGFADGPANTAQFNGPESVAADSQGNIYVADTGNERIRKISTAGIVSTLAGNGKSGYMNGGLLEASFNAPTAVALDAKGNVYVTDYQNYRIRKITLQ